MTVLTAFLDANVLFPAATRSVLLELARKKVFRLLWSERVHEEWTRNLAARFPHIRPRRSRACGRSWKATSTTRPFPATSR